MKRLLYILAALVASAGMLLSQSDAGAIFVLISPTPTMNALGGIGVCLPSDDPMTGYFNPANGIQGLEGVGISGAAIGRTPWIFDTYIDHSAIQVGLLPADAPVKLVAGYYHTFLDGGEQVRTNEWGYIEGISRTTFSTDAYTISMAYKFQLKGIPTSLALGFADKTVDQELWRDEKSHDRLVDYGFLVSFPFHKQPMKELDLQIQPALGYSSSNIGSDIKVGTYNPDPAPRYARLGLSVSAKIIYQSRWPIFEIRAGQAASDLLVTPRDSTQDRIYYQKGLGDIDLLQNVILNHSGSKVTVHQGLEYSFFNLYTIRSGAKIDETGGIHLKTTGYGIKSAGLFRILQYLMPSRALERLQHRVDIQYNYSKWETDLNHPLNDLEFESISLTITHLLD